MGATSKQQDQGGDLESIIAEYRETVVVAGYTRLIKLLSSSVLTEDLETACKIGHMLKEMGLV